MVAGDDTPSTAVFVRGTDGRCSATELARGPWDPGQAHGGAPAALLAAAIEAVDEPGGFAVSRMAMDFLGAVPIGVPLSVEAQIVKPGRRFQLVEATLAAEGRELVRARAVRLHRTTVDAPTSPGPAMPPPLDGGTDFGGLTEAIGGPPTGFFPTAMDIRLVDGRPGTGVATAWFCLRAPVLAGEVTSPLQRAVAVADFANGLSFRVPLGEWLFVNCDLTVHLSRDPVGPWIALAARTDLGDAGAGVAAGTLFDATGRIGTVAQSLFVSRRA